MLTPWVIEPEKYRYLSGVISKSALADASEQLCCFYVHDKAHLADYDAWLRAEADGRRNWKLEFARELKPFYELPDDEFPLVLSLVCWASVNRASNLRDSILLTVQDEYAMICFEGAAERKMEAMNT